MNEVAEHTKYGPSEADADLQSLLIWKTSQHLDLLMTTQLVRPFLDHINEITNNWWLRAGCTNHT